jgi:hypothetical protein
MIVEDIGFAAGRVWRLLSDQGPLSLSKLGRTVEGGSQLALMAVGWLAREGKVELYREGRAHLVRLTGK